MIDRKRAKYIPAYQRSFRLSTAACASVSHSYRAYTLPMRWSPTLSHTWARSILIHGKTWKDSHATRVNGQTWPTHSTGPHTLRRTLLATLVLSIYRRGRGRGCDRRWGAVLFEKTGVLCACANICRRVCKHQSRPK